VIFQLFHDSSKTNKISISLIQRKFNWEKQEVRINFPLQFKSNPQGFHALLEVNYSFL
jgi:hypothetical protein